ncbi:hypothetical protein OJF2_57650 [Aquisphaera giovannonii]|uniref:Uncharacterized protein n=1 Tax=Aquisphaera giovannonii TaxID=406548 RepID=A0A5B9W975_9BACT|nr:hypothetical protein OJF2_57650 [Aquisphaera giovannonii]
MVATSLKLVIPGRRVQGARVPEGIAFTAVSPFYKE